MNCRDAEPLLFAERDGALTSEERAALAQHVAACPACRRACADLAAANAALRTAAANVAVPDADREWQVLRQRLTAQSPRRVGARRLAPVAWIGLSLAAAAALALAFLGGHRPFGGNPDAADLARAEFVEVKDSSASTMVYVDQESGWLVVWAVPDSSAKG